MAFWVWVHKGQKYYLTHDHEDDGVKIDLLISSSQLFSAILLLVLRTTKSEKEGRKEGPKHSVLNGGKIILSGLKVP